MSTFIFTILVVSGAVLLAGSLGPIRGLVKRLLRGSMRRRWSFLLARFPLHTAAPLKHTDTFEQVSISDPQIPAFDRDRLDRRLSEEVSRAFRHGLPLSLLRFDLDHFEEIVDRHGNKACDLVLAQFEDRLRGELREQDVLARCGVDEFMVIAVHVNHVHAVALAERLRKCIETSWFNFPGETGRFEIFLTCSIGVATLGLEQESAEKLLRLVDDNLHQAKREGRNRVNAFRPGGGPTAATRAYSGFHAGMPDPGLS